MNIFRGYIAYKYAFFVLSCIGNMYAIDEQTRLTLLNISIQMANAKVVLDDLTTYDAKKIELLKDVITDVHAKTNSILKADLDQAISNCLKTHPNYNK